MKKSILAPLASLLLMALLGLSACQKKDDNNGGAQADVYAQTPCSATNLTNCNNGAYNQYGNNQVQFLTYQGNYNNGFCGCPAGYRPIMNPTMGLSCAPANFFGSANYNYNNGNNRYGYASRYSYGSNSGYVRWGYSYSTINNYGNYGHSQHQGGITQQPGQNSQWSSIPQVTYSAALSGTNSNCYTQAAATCDLRAANSCGGNGVCRPTGGGTYLGICSYGRGAENYQQANGCIQRTNNGGYYNICGYGNAYSYDQNQQNYNQLPVR